MQTKNVDYIKVILSLVSIFCIIGMVTYTFTGSNLVSNSDYAVANILGEEMFRTKSLFPQNWTYGQDIWVFFLNIPIAFLTIFMDDYLIMRSISSLFFIILTLCTLWLLSKKVLKDNSWLLFIPLIFCGLSSEVNNTLFGQTAYLPIIMYMALCLYLFCNTINENYEIKSKRKFLILFIVIVFIGLQGVRYIETIDLPLLGAIAIHYLISKKNDSSKQIKETIRPVIKLFMLIGIAIVVGMVGFLLILHSINFVYGAAGNYIVSSFDEVVNNFKSAVSSFLELIGFKYNTRILSMVNVFNTIRIFAGIFICVVFPVKAIKKYKEENMNTQIFLIFSLLYILETFYFSLFANLGEVRYYLPTLVLCIIISSHYIYKYILQEKKFLISTLVVVILLFLAIPNAGANILSAKGYQEKLEQNKGLVYFLDNNNLEYGYATFWNAGINEVLSNGKIRINGIQIQNTVQPFYWLNSRDRFLPETYTGKTFILMTLEEKNTFDNSGSYQTLGEPIEKLCYNDTYYIYVYDYNICFDNFYGKGIKELELLSLMSVSNSAQLQENGILLDSENFIYGPYLSLKKGKYKVVIESKGMTDDFSYSITASNGQEVLSTGNISADRQEIQFVLEEPVYNLEFVIRTQQQSPMKITSIMLNAVE